MSNIYRDVTLNQVSEQDIGKTIRVAGWVENIRDHGGVSFIDLRDMYAVMQIVIRDGKLLEGIRKEQAITVEGLIEKRDEETYNPTLFSRLLLRSTPPAVAIAVRTPFLRKYFNSSSAPGFASIGPSSST